MKIALVGNQNSGKTTLFNLLTGMNQKIGNWPGVTLEKKSGFIKGTRHELIDLPGIYSLSSYTTEEKIAREFLIDSKCDFIINIVDATSIERGLYLTTELLELDANVILVLNMADRLKQKGIDINKKELENKLGINVCVISALKKEGIDELISLISSKECKKKKISVFQKDVEEAIFHLADRIDNLKNKRLKAIEMLEFSNVDTALMHRNKISKKYNMDIYEILITQRYEFISNVCSVCLKRNKTINNISYILDKIFLNKILAFPIFILIMFLIYYLSVGGIGRFFSEFISNFINRVEEFFESFLFSIGVSQWLISMVCNGIIKGVGSLFAFLPQLIILFLCISILESSGYMSRISFLLDKVFRKFGLSGKSLIPFIIGTGCSVPGIMSSRIIEDDYARKLTASVTSFIPCTAKLPIITLFSSYFFNENQSFIAISFYLLAVIMIIISTLIINKCSKNKIISSYVSELPNYQIPSIKHVVKDVFDKVLEFLRKAGTIIFLSSICVWFLLSFSTNFIFGVEIDESILAFLGKKISWFFSPIVGHNSWEISVSALQGLIAKEQVISSMEIISGLTNDAKNSFEIFGSGGPFSFFNKASSYAFTCFNLFSAPCMAAIASLKKELGSFKKVSKVIFFQTFLAWCVSVIIFNLSNFYLTFKGGF